MTTPIVLWPLESWIALQFFLLKSNRISSHRRKLRMIHDNWILFYFFHLFHIFHIKSVSNWHQSEVWKIKNKKKPPHPRKLLPNVPFFNIRTLLRLPSSGYHSWYHSPDSQSTHRRMQYFTDFSKQKKKNGRGSTPQLEIKKKKLLLHWLDFPSREKSSATTFCVRKPSSAGGHVRACRVPEQRERGGPERVSAHPRALLICFINKNRRGMRLLVKFTIQSFESLRGGTRRLGWAEDRYGAVGTTGSKSLLEKKPGF